MLPQDTSIYTIVLPKSMLINVYLDVLMCLGVSWCVLGCPRVFRLSEKDDPLLEKN